MPEQRLSAIADRTVWEKITKGRAGIRCDSVVEKAWKDKGRGPRSNTVHRQVCGVQNRSKRKDRKKGKASAKRQGEGGRTLEDM